MSFNPDEYVAKVLNNSRKVVEDNNADREVAWPGEELTIEQVLLALIAAEIAAIRHAIIERRSDGEDWKNGE